MEKETKLDVKSELIDIKAESGSIPGTSQDSVQIISLRENRSPSSSSRPKDLKRMNLLEFFQESKFSSLPTKPPFTIIELITIAITSTPRPQLTLKEVVSFISKTFPFYHNCPGLEEFVKENIKKGNFKCQCNCVPRSGNELKCYMSENDLWSVNPFSAAVTIQNMFETHRKRGSKRNAISSNHKSSEKVARLSENPEMEVNRQQDIKTNKEKLEALCNISVPANPNPLNDVAENITSLDISEALVSVEDSVVDLTETIGSKVLAPSVVDLTETIGSKVLAPSQNSDPCSPTCTITLEDTASSMSVDDNQDENSENCQSEMEEIHTASDAHLNEQCMETPHVCNTEEKEGTSDKLQQNKDNLEGNNGVNRVFPVTEEIIRVRESKSNIEDSPGEDVVQRGPTLKLKKSEESQNEKENSIKMLIPKTGELMKPESVNKMKDGHSKSDEHSKQEKRNKNLVKESDETRQNKKKRESEYERPRESLFRLIATAIITDPKGFLELNEIYNYIAQKFPFYQNKKYMVKQCLQDSLKKRHIIHIPGNKLLSKSCWTLHPIVAVKLFGNRNHLTRPKSDVPSIGPTSETPKQPSVILKRSPRVDQLALEYQKHSTENQAEGSSSKETIQKPENPEPRKESLAPAWEGWSAPSPQLLETHHFLERLVEKIVHFKNLSQSDERSDQACSEVEETFCANEDLAVKDSSPSEPFEANKLANSQSEIKSNFVNDSTKDGLEEEIPQGKNQDKDEWLGFDLDYWSGNWRGWHKVTSESKQRNQLMKIINQLDLQQALEDCERAATLTVEKIEKDKAKYLAKLKSVKSKNITEEEKGPRDLNDLLQQQVEDLMGMVVNTSSMPPFSFTVLIVMAMVTSPEPSLTLKDIYLYIQEKFPFYRSRNDCWQLSIQLTLRLSSQFLKVCQGCHLKKTQFHGGCWTIDFADASLILASALETEKNKVLQNDCFDIFKPADSIKSDDLIKNTVPKLCANSNTCSVNEAETAREVTFNSTLGFNVNQKVCSRLDDIKKLNELPENGNLNLNSTSLDLCKSADEIMEECKSITDETLILCDKLVESLSSNWERDLKVNRVPKVHQHSVHVPNEKIEEESVNRAPKSFKEPCTNPTVELSSDSDAILTNGKHKLSPIKSSVSKSSFACEICDRRFSCFFVLKHHKFSKHSKVETHPCYLCHQVFSSSQILWVHLVVNHQGKKNIHVMSSVCDLHSVSSHNHLPKSSEPSENCVIKCTKCSAVFLSKLKLSLHMKEHHEDQYKIKCNHCNPTKTFPSEEALKIHLQAMHPSAGDFLYVCDRCGADFLQEETLQSHLKLIHPAEKRKYDTIPKRTDHSDSVEKEDNIVFVCKNCDGCYISEKSFSSHTCYYREKI